MSGPSLRTAHATWAPSWAWHCWLHAGPCLADVHYYEVIMIITIMKCCLEPFCGFDLFFKHCCCCFMGKVSDVSYYVLWPQILPMSDAKEHEQFYSYDLARFAIFHNIKTSRLFVKNNEKQALTEFESILKRSLRLFLQVWTCCAICNIRNSTYLE